MAPAYCLHGRPCRTTERNASIGFGRPIYLGDEDVPELLSFESPELLPDDPEPDVVRPEVGDDG
jgi:hypothetical protein